MRSKFVLLSGQAGTSVVAVGLPAWLQYCREIVRCRLVRASAHFLARTYPERLRYLDNVPVIWIRVPSPV